MLMKRWFKTWDRPEYKEWAIKSPNGYQLVIIRKERKSRYLCVKAKLIMDEKGLPDFKAIEEYYHPTKEKALKQIKEWK